MGGPSGPLMFLTSKNMKIKSDIDRPITTTWGTSIFLTAGEEREVGDDLGLEALMQGATQVIDTPAPKKRAAPKKKAAPKNKTRARTDKGHYVADDPATPDVNEAYVDGAEDD